MKRKEVPFISFPASKVTEEDNDGPEIEMIRREGEIINESLSNTDTSYDTNSSQREFFIHEEYFDYLNSNEVSDSSTTEESYTSGLSEYENDITLIRRTRDTFRRNDILSLDINYLRRDNINDGLSNEEVNRLYSSKYSDIITNISECGICKGGFLDLNIVTELRCSHIFHSTCVIPWVLGNNNCPMCRQHVVDR
eukprot:jgi/Antlo1/255/2367